MFSELNIDDFLTKLGQHRPIFHSEADFQHAFAWQLHELFPDANIRLEYPFQADKLYYLDIWAEANNEALGIELKYKTKILNTEINGEKFILKHHSAHDLGRYDFIKDLCRLEQARKHYKYEFTGYAIILSNDAYYWSTRRSDTIDSAFHLTHTKILSGHLSWSANASFGTTKGRTTELKLNGSYPLNWKTYSTPSNTKSSEFQYLALRVT